MLQTSLPPLIWFSSELVRVNNNVEALIHCPKVYYNFPDLPKLWVVSGVFFSARSLFKWIMEFFVPIFHRSSGNTLWKVIPGRCPTSSTYTGNRQTLRPLLVWRSHALMSRLFLSLSSQISKGDCMDKGLIHVAFKVLYLRLSCWPLSCFFFSPAGNSLDLGEDLLLFLSGTE